MGPSPTKIRDRTGPGVDKTTPGTGFFTVAELHPIVKDQLLIALYFLVALQIAGMGIEPICAAYETAEQPLLQPAVT